MDRGTIMHPQIRLRGIDGKQSLWFPDPDRPLLSITISNPLKMLPICFHRGLWVSPTNRAFSGPAARSGHLGPPRTTGRRPSAVGRWLHKSPLCTLLRGGPATHTSARAPAAAVASSHRPPCDRPRLTFHNPRKCPLTAVSRILS